MQCFQKDPNLRVSARKLLKHAWIIGCRRSDAPVSKAPSNFRQAVEEVKQWNRALRSSESSHRMSTGSDSGNLPVPGNPGGRLNPLDANRTSAPSHAARGALAIPKSRPITDDFRSPELPGKRSSPDELSHGGGVLLTCHQATTTGTVTSPQPYRQQPCTCPGSRGRITLADCSLRTGLWR